MKAIKYLKNFKKNFFSKNFHMNKLTYLYSEGINKNRKNFHARFFDSGLTIKNEVNSNFNIIYFIISIS